METELVISKGGFPPFSARGCEQELTPLSLGQFRRTVNGDLVFLGIQGKKYKTIITCSDQAVIATDGLEPGSIVTVQCIQRLWQKATGPQVTLERPAVENTIYAIDENRQPVQIISCHEKEITLANEKEVFVTYRPSLNMRVLRYSLSTNEWGIKTGWRLELEEI